MPNVTEYQVRIAGPAERLRQIAILLAAAVVTHKGGYLGDDFIETGNLWTAEDEEAQAVGVYAVEEAEPGNTVVGRHFQLSERERVLSFAGASAWAAPTFLARLAMANPDVEIDLTAVTEDEIRERVAYKGNETKTVDYVEEDFRSGIYKWHVRDGVRHDPPLICGPDGSDLDDDGDCDAGSGGADRKECNPAGAEDVLGGTNDDAPIARLVPPTVNRHKSRQTAVITEPAAGDAAAAD